MENHPCPEVSYPRRSHPRSHPQRPMSPRVPRARRRRRRRGRAAPRRARGSGRSRPRRRAPRRGSTLTETFSVGPPRRGSRLARGKSRGAAETPRRARARRRRGTRSRRSPIRVESRTGFRRDAEARRRFRRRRAPPRGASPSADARFRSGRRRDRRPRPRLGPATKPRPRFSRTSPRTSEACCEPRRARARATHVTSNALIPTFDVRRRRFLACFLLLRFSVLLRHPPFSFSQKARTKAVSASPRRPPSRRRARCPGRRSPRRARGSRSGAARSA